MAKRKYTARERAACLDIIQELRKRSRYSHSDHPHSTSSSHTQHAHHLRRQPTVLRCPPGEFIVLDSCDTMQLAAENTQHINSVTLLPQTAKKGEEIDLDLIDYEELEDIIKHGGFGEGYAYEGWLILRFEKVDQDDTLKEERAIDAKQEKELIKQAKKRKHEKYGEFLTVGVVGLLGLAAATLTR